ncbi:MAG: C40 family peptidase [Hyphomonas sp.]|nr:C40 family peptidase [Hyphomonas sp.]
MVEYVDLLGTPFTYQGRGPTEYDCYGVLIEMHRRIGKTIPDYKSPDDLVEIAEIIGREKRLWDEVWKREEAAPNMADIPLHSTLVLRVKGLACHVGFVIGPNKFIHTWQGSGGVLVERISLWRQKIIGVYEFND